MVPVTFHHSWNVTSDNERLALMREFAANGAKHLVVSIPLLEQLNRNYTLLCTVKEQALEAGVDFVDSHAPIRELGDLFIPEKQAWRQMIARQKLNLLLSNELGAETCTFHVGTNYYQGYTIDQHREAFYRSLDELLPIADKLNMTLCLENMIRPLSMAEDLVYYIERYDTPLLGICFDSGHANLKEKGKIFPECKAWDVWEKEFGLPVQWEENIAEKLQPHIVSCHIHDNNGYYDEHQLTGCGTVDWERIVPVILNAPRLQNIQSEINLLRNSIPIRTAVNNIFDRFGVIAEY